MATGTVEMAKSGNANALEQVIQCIKDGQSFILEAGAGSGKTWTLVESLKFLLEEYGNSLAQNNQRIVCITYTNVAADEIHERIENNPLVVVSTIHDFLWSEIKMFQNELKAEMIEYNQTSAKEPIADFEDVISSLTVTYSQYGRKFEQGRITHDDVISFAGNIFSKHQKILRIVAQKYPFIFVDEYQDTQPTTVNLLLEHLLPANKGLIVGFFGDSMQKIYGHGIGTISHKSLKTVTKKDNFRCPIKVIELLNKMRPDLIQVPSGKNKEGEAIFFHCHENSGEGKENFEKVLAGLEKRGWDTGAAHTKILMLTHKSIARKLDYIQLLGAYAKLSSFGREILFERDEPFSKFLIDKLEVLVSMYEQKQYGEFIRMLGDEGFSVTSHSDKEALQKKMESLSKLREGGTVKDVMEYVFKNKLATKPEKIEEFEAKITKKELDESDSKKKTFYDALMEVPYKEVMSVTQFINDNTPFSTKHGVKGAEYENVIVAIDDGSWNLYKFNDVFAGNTDNQDRYDRTLNLLYVSCSRAKSKLAVVTLSDIDTQAKQGVINWFGDKNVLSIMDS